MTLSIDNINYTYLALVNLWENGYNYIHANCVYEKGWTIEHARVLYNELKKVADYLLNNHLE
ncbi:MAG: radical SAM protein, partial [Clostridium sp.]|nr:radical SAM protein [Clostridium sp.]